MRQMYQTILSFIFILSLASCSGGSSLGDTTTDDSGTVTGTVTISLTLLDAQGTSTVDVDTDNPVTAQAAVLVDGAAQSNVKVLFSLEDDIGELRVTTALTSSDGIATVTLYAGSVTGAGTLTATADSASVAQNFSAVISADGTTDDGTVNPLSMALLNAQGVATLNVSSSSPVTVQASLTIDGEPQPGEKITFALVDQVGALTISTALTNETGIASVVLYAGENEGAGTVTATTDSYFQSSNFSVSISAVDVTMSTISTTPNTIGPNGTSSLSVLISESVDGVSTPLSESIGVEFSSACSQLGLAQIDDDVTTINGVATATYQDQGCGQIDTITVSSTVGQTTLFETTELTVLAATTGSIEFVSADPTFIALRGTGGLNRSETSSLVFVVKDIIGNVVSDALVNFSLNTDVGGITMSPETQAKTNSAGEVTVIVTAGTVPTSVIVTASLDENPLIATISGSLAISTGVLDANSFSISVSDHAPEAWNYDGAQVDVTARLADHFNNPVPDGTIVSFSTEFGAIEPSCSTEGGLCSVTWTSQSPKSPDPAFRDTNAITRLVDTDVCYNGSVPSNLNTSSRNLACPGTLGSVYGNRVTIFAHAIGEESFNDANANGRFDANEAYTDLSEAFQDDNNDGLFTALLADGSSVDGAALATDPGYQTGGDNEEFVDFDGDQMFDAPNGIYNGVLCNDTQDGCSNELITVSKNAVISQAGSFARIGLIEAGLDVFEQSNYFQSVNLASSNTVVAYIADLHNGTMPTGTTVEFETTNGAIVGPSSFEVTNSSGVNVASVVLDADDETSSGVLLITVTTPNGNVSTASISITD